MADGEGGLSDPFLITGPALISFSGGRTSAYMLWRILQAHGGVLPEDVIVAFANTGKEREETLRFVHECGSRWGVDIVWLERRSETKFEVVGYNSASRAGEPFAELITQRRFTPNGVSRFCTTELKVRPIKHYLLSIGWAHWANIIGLRHDEGHRVLKSLAKNDDRKERWVNRVPLANGKVTKRDVRAFFWGSPDASFETRELVQGFDLELRDYEGNCDLCMLKSRAKKVAIIRENPGCGSWWSEREILTGGSFVIEYSYAQLVAEVEAQGFLPFDQALDDEEHDAECGLWCAGEAA